MSEVANTQPGVWKKGLFSDQQFEATELRRSLAAFRYDMDRALSAGSAFVFMSLALTSGQTTGRLTYPLILWLFRAFGIIIFSESVALALLGGRSNFRQWIYEFLAFLLVSLGILVFSFSSTIIHAPHVAPSMGAASAIMVVTYVSKLRSGKLLDRINHKLLCQETSRAAH